MGRRQSPKQDGGDTSYDIGYGKPPVTTRFKPGQSGNPKGRPKGVRNFGTDVRATLKAPVKVTRDGRARKVSTQEAALFRLREKALTGDARALDRLLSLAQTYSDNAVVAAAASLGADDAVVLATYQARFLSGAASQSISTDSNEGCESAAPTDSKAHQHDESEHPDVDDAAPHGEASEDEGGRS